ncbi:MAG TPA: hypothetical protein PLV83_06250, partial [Bacilli bacterium]|nr:hypothetical protein [Bacilli bacterium]
GINTFGNDSTITSILSSVVNGIAIAMIINSLINTIIRCWVRFKSNMYGDESYLTHTLPVSRKTLYLSKILTAIISMLASVVVCLISLFIMYYSKDNIELLKQILLKTADVYNISTFTLITTVSLALFLEFLFVVLAGYIGLIIGYSFSNNKLPKTFVSGFLVYMISQLLVIGIIFFIGLFYKDVMVLFNSSSISSMSVIKNVLCICIGIYLVYVIVCYYVGNKLFSKGVNVE